MYTFFEIGESSSPIPSEVSICEAGRSLSPNSIHHSDPQSVYRVWLKGLECIRSSRSENHLHPSLQRSLFVKLVEAFPLTQFIIATHSPFIVSGLKDSNVYVLRDRRIIFTHPFRGLYL